jgi:hypothetical protein
MADMDRPRLESLIHNLIGCDWGRKVTAAVDREPCEAQAARRVAIHQPGGGEVVTVLQLCTRHLALIETHTNPHQEEV